MNAHAGRPRQFRNAAERQKAYRDRKRNMGALRNSDVDPIAQLKVVEKAAGRECDEHRALFYQWGVIEDRYPEWARRASELQEAWWKAHQAWWNAKNKKGTQSI